MSEQVEVKITTDDEKTLVIEVVDGKTKTYYRNPIRTMCLEVHELLICSTARAYHMGEELESLPDPKLMLRGTAWLGRSSLCVIGNPQTSTHTLPVTFKVLTDAERISTEENSKKYNRPLRYTGATIGFMYADWEIGNGDDWFIECYVSAATFAAMASTVESGKLRKASIGLHLDDIYTDDNWAPPSFNADWFLRPNRKYPKNGPDLVRGDITTFDLEMTSVCLGPPPEVSGDVGGDVDERQNYDNMPVVSPEVVALEKLGTNIEKLRGTVKWVGGFIAVFLCFLVIKGT
jgi:hypothetical protein